MPVARDVLLALAIVTYVIGFAYQTAKMQQLHVGVAWRDQGVTSVFAWAVVALRDGAPAYTAMAAGALALVAAAFVVKRRCSKTFCAPLVTALLVASAITAVVGSAWFAWRQGSIPVPASFNEMPLQLHVPYMR